MAKFKLNNKKYESYSRTYIEWYETNDWRLNRAIQMCQNLEYFWTWKWRLNLWNTSKVVVPKRDKTDWELKVKKNFKMIYQFCFILLFLRTNADLLWWNRNRNNDLFPGVSVGKRFHSLHWRTSWLAITWFFLPQSAEAIDAGKLNIIENWRINLRTIIEGPLLYGKIFS